LVDIEKVAVCSSLRSLKPKCTIESRAKRSSKIISLGHYSIMLASSHTVKRKTDIKSPMHNPCVGFNSLVYSFRALSTLRRSGLRTASTAAKPCQGDSSEFYLITGTGVTMDEMDKLGIGIVFCTEVLRINSIRAFIKCDVIGFFSLLFSYVKDSEGLGNYNTILFRCVGRGKVLRNPLFITEVDKDAITEFSTIFSSELFDFDVILIFNYFDEGRDSFRSYKSKQIRVKKMKTFLDRRCLFCFEAGLMMLLFSHDEHG
nr:hypothetical protein [Tanacetum cinerariifolium]